MEILEDEFLRRHQRADASYPSVPKAGSRPAGFVRRAIAYLIDSLILFSLFLVLIFSGIAGLRFSGGFDTFYYSGTGELFFLGYFFLYTGYYTFFHAYGGQTPAKMIMRIKVLKKDGEVPSYLHSLVRTFGFFLSHLFFGFGFFLTLIERRKRALHDLLTGTEVVLSE